MDIQDAQHEIIWLVSGALGTWVSPKVSILAVIIGGFFIFPLTQNAAAFVGPLRVREQRESCSTTLGMRWLSHRLFRGCFLCP